MRDFRLSVFDSDFRFRISDFGFWILDFGFGFRISDFEIGLARFRPDPVSYRTQKYKSQAQLGSAEFG